MLPLGGPNIQKTCSAALILHLIFQWRISKTFWLLKHSGNKEPQPSSVQNKLSYHFVHSDTSVYVLQGKVFPKLKKRSSTARLIDQDRNGEEQTAADYVFRIVYPGYRYDASK